MKKLLASAFCIILFGMIALNAHAQESPSFSVNTDCKHSVPPYANDFTVTYARTPSNNAAYVIKFYRDARLAAWVATATLQPTMLGDTAWNPKPIDASTLSSLYSKLVDEQFFCDQHAEDTAPMEQRELDGTKETITVQTSGIIRTFTLDSQIPNWALRIIEQIKASAQ